MPFRPMPLVSNFLLFEKTDALPSAVIAEGNIITSPFPMDFPLEVFNQITLDENEGITTLTIQGHPLNATEAQVETYHSIRDSMKQGFGGTFDQLEAYLAEAQK